MVAKLIIFNGINEQWQNIFVFLYNFLCTFATTKIFDLYFFYYDTLAYYRGIGRRHGFGPALPGFQIRSGQHGGNIPLPHSGGQCYRLPAHRHFLRIDVARQSGWRLCQTPPHHRSLRWLHHILYLLQREPLAHARRPRYGYIIIYQRQRRAGIHCRGCGVLDCRENLESVAYTQQKRNRPVKAKA